ncbi:MAG TPA: LppP/LprE family lipoprotein [Solirubrobacteraceae bacterium]|jgi:hypothetical protein|nr:LppP/LprE family lipoprotein [Solirubrobacteraceae bacterium]
MLLAGVLAIAGCGGSGASTANRAATGANGANAAGTNAARSSTATGSAGSATDTTTTGTTTGQSAAGGTTRTAPAPAFVEHGGGSSGGGGAREEGLAQAVSLVKAHGFTPNETSQYHPDQTLRVLVAIRTGSNDGYDQQAFFFVGDRYVGTDASSPSAGIAVVSQRDAEVTLGYRLYRPGDPLCCARGGQGDVRFQLNNGRLLALDPIPPVSSSSAPSRQ